MKVTLEFLGTGGSMGMPVIGCECPRCVSKDPHNARLRPAALLCVDGHTFLIDPGIDLRQQLLRAKVSHLDAILVTHAHQDHVGGLDELRIFQVRRPDPIPMLLSQQSLHELESRFSYMFSSEKKHTVVPRFALNILEEPRGEVVFGGVKWRYFSYKQAGMQVLGFRLKTFAYVTDIREYPDSVFEDLEGVETLVLSALRHKPSHLHFSVEEAVMFAEKVGAKSTYLTHIAHELDHQETNRNLPEHIRLAYDGCLLEMRV